MQGKLYWGWWHPSNTPTEAVFDDKPRIDSLIFCVHLWNPAGSEPTTMAEVFNRHRDVQYSSRIARQIARQQQIHRLRHVINELAARLPEAERESAAVHELRRYGCQTRMHVVRLLAPQGGGLRTHKVSFIAQALGGRIRSALRCRFSRTHGNDATGRGVTATTRIFSREILSAAPMVAAKLGAPEGATVARVSRLHAKHRSLLPKPR